jgi:cell division transport system ATP-binding protein
VIRFENVAKVYDETSLPALVDVTLDITRGEFIYLVGASGSGKSTFLQLVLREHKATSGQVLVAGKDIAALSSWKVPHLRRQMGAVFQDFRLLPNKTVYENVAFALQVIGRSRQAINQTVPETLEMVGLSGKERRRAHRKPRPDNESGHHAGAGTDQQHGHHDRDGHPRRRARRRVPAPCRRARRRPGHSR